jgi:hypothetical protein
MVTGWEGVIDGTEARSADGGGETAGWEEIVDGLDFTSADGNVETAT